MKAALLISLALAAAHQVCAGRVENYVCPSKCASDIDCSLNGVCNTGTGQCQCDVAWVGQCCQTLNFLPVDPKQGGGYRHPNTSTWGGNIIIGPDGNAHMWIAEMAPNGTATDPGAGSCGLTTWGSNSQITHVSSTTGILGPYVRQEVAVGVWSHNPLVRQVGNTYVLYHIGSGAGGKPGDGYCAGNATSPCGEQSFDQCSNTSVCSGAAVPGYACFDGVCSGDATKEGDCGGDIAEPTLNCDTYAACATAAAAACANTTGCVSFGLSEAWGLGKAKLFSAGKGGLTPNDQWTVWVQNGHRSSSGSSGSSGSSAGVTAAGETAGEIVGHSYDMYARARIHGRWPVPPPKVAPDGSCMLELHTSNSTAGPWVPYPNATITPCAGNNPAPWVHPNGTIYVVFTDQNMGLYRADSWEGPYTLVVSGACGGGEDPSLFIDKRGYFHCMYHRSPFSVPDIAIGHAWSVDGFTWYAANDPAANSTIQYSGGYGAVVHGKRERPHPYFNAQGDMAAFVSGVCIEPRCNPFEGAGIDPTADCSSGTQYHHCDANSPDGWYDRTYTLVQGVVTPAADE